MKALTLMQPWASLMATGAKTIETRSWRTHYTGELAIHAAKGFPAWGKAFARDPRFVIGVGGLSIEDLPRSRVVCIVDLIGCVRTSEMHKAAFLLGRKPSATEIMFGDYGPNRWAWVTRNVRLVDDPGPTQGALSLWEWVRGPKPEAVRQAIANEAVARGEATA